MALGHAHGCTFGTRTGLPATAHTPERGAPAKGPSSWALPSLAQVRLLLQSKQEGWLHLVVEVVVHLQEAMLVMQVMLIHVLQKLDLIQALVEVVLVILHSAVAESACSDEKQPLPIACLRSYKELP